MGNLYRYLAGRGLSQCFSRNVFCLGFVRFRMKFAILSRGSPACIAVEFLISLYLHPSRSSLILLDTLTA